MKILISVILIISIVPREIKAQDGCIDSLSFNHFISPYFGEQLHNSNTIKDSADNFYINGYGNPPGQQNYNLVKFNANNELVWFKVFKTTPFTQVTPSGLNAIDKNRNLIFCTGATNGTTTSILKSDSAANFLWGKQLQRSDVPSAQGVLGGPVIDDNNDIYVVGRFMDDKESTHIVKLDYSGNIRWSKKYGNPNLPKFHSLELFLIAKDESTIVLFNHFFYDDDNPTDPLAKHGLQMVEINKTDGSILQQKTLMYYNDSGGNSPNYFTLKKINFNKSTGKFLLDSWGQVQPPFFRAHIFTLLNSNLNLIQSSLYNSTMINPGENLDISINNQVVLAINQLSIGNDPNNYFSFIVLDENLDIVKQRKINLTNLSFSSLNVIANIIFKKNNVLNFQIKRPYGTVATNNSLYIADNSPFYQNINSDCLGKDTVIYTPGNIYTLPVDNVSYYDLGDIPFSATDVTPDPYEEHPFPKMELCKQISICDTIKLFGTQYHCLSSPIDSFKIYKNPFCIRKTDWQVDTSYIKVLSQTDTSLHVQYLRPYRGMVKVGFGGCSLADSMAIEVYNAKTGVNLGNDTMYCPGKTITLKAGRGFKTYQWQNGTTNDSLVAAQPGLYHVTATDSCGNIFKDTLLIQPFDVVLKTDYPQWLCPKDTVTFNLPSQLTNYSWLPNTNSSLSNYTWQLFPSTTTTYSITGERLPGCTVSDTVLINVRPNCLPDYIYFPTGFTPNGDGLNDTYKPGINGHLVVYEFTIFNRYGQLVFRTTDPTQGWDGSFKNAKNPLSGGYVWTCRYQFTGKLLQQEQGSFTLIR